MRLLPVLFCTTCLFASAASAVQFPTLETIWQFGAAGDGDYPGSEVSFDSHGNMYGTTLNGGAFDMGAVYQLKQNGAGWAESVIYSFGNLPDGATPESPVLPGSDGALYTATRNGGASNLGAVVKLTPPATAGSDWTETILYSFTGPDGANPQYALAWGKDGALYGVTSLGGASGQGTVYRLAPPATAGDAWTQSVLLSFTAKTARALCPRRWPSPATA